MSIPKINKHEWESKLKEIKVNKSDLNKLIMNYLMMQGYQEAIEAFEQESSSITTTATNTDTTTATTTDTINNNNNNNNNNHSINHNNISTRVTIRNELMNGNISKAIQLINNFNPKLLQSSPKLYFHLKNQQFIEFIKNNQLDEALQFAQLEIAPIITIENEIDFLNEMEKSMSLLAFSEMESSPFGILLTSVQRKKIASEVNFEILKILDSSSKKGNTDNENKDNDDTSVVDLNIVTKLHYLLKVLQYLQLKLQEKKSFPKIENFVTCELVQSKMVLNNNSHLNSGGISGISGISGLHNEEEMEEEEEEEEEEL